MTFALQDQTFTRSLRPVSKRHAFENPSLVIFSDGFMQDFGAIAYIRWQIGEESSDSRLMTVKSRLAPIRTQTIPRLELCGAPLTARLRTTIVKELKVRLKKKNF